MAGYLIATIVGVTGGLALGRSRMLARIFDPLVGGFFAVPRIILYPVLLAAIGISFESKLWLSAISAVFPILLHTSAGVRAVNPVLVKVGRSLGCSLAQRIRLIYLPSATPAIMVGLRIGFSIALISTVFAELFAAAEGIGLRLQQAFSLQQYTQMFAIVLLISLVAFTGSLIFWAVELRLRRMFA
jgi:NitT/TauT family transport system permease protein